MVKREEIIYLAGPINDKTDEECMGWRNQLKHTLLDKMSYKEFRTVARITILDPMRRDYRTKEHMYRTFIYFDKRDIRECTFFIAYVPYATLGTAMEIMYAFERNKHIVIITDNPKVEEHGWILLHANKIVKNVKEAVEYLEDTIKRTNSGIWKW